MRRRTEKNILLIKVLNARNRITLQKEYCKTNNLRFVSPEVFCPQCEMIYWNLISDEKASSSHITYCDYCNYEFEGRE